MELSLFLARLWGLFAIIVSIGLLLNRKSFMSMIKHLEKDAISVLLAGIIALGIGIAQVVGYNFWTFDYKGLITLFGWVSLLKGIAILFVPGYAEQFAKVFAKAQWYIISFMIFLIAGIYLLYMGFIA